mmetsp:Transcript_36985/g.47798  ORF Transcript_36985/g.47798 Transcript_36985/m.47798 type:complete len:1038 (+) Transcript_36985:104-3217(+)
MKPFGLVDPSKVKPGSMKTISQTKLATFVVGQQKKTRFQKEKEAKEAKKKQELTEAAGLYEDFVTSFNPEENSKTFMRGSNRNESNDRTYKMKSSSSSSIFSSSPQLPKSSPPPSSSSRRSLDKKPMSEMERMLEEMKEQESTKSGVYRSSNFSGSSSASSTQQGNQGRPSGFSSSGGKPTSGIGMMSYGGVTIPVIESKGSHDDGGGDSTNLYVGNLAPITTEETLNELFAKFGEIYSVKIMWPRTDEEKARKRNCGFVSFMQRPDAADAKEAMHNADVDGYVITVGWGKAIKKLSNNPTMLGQAGGFLKVREDAVQPGLAPEVHDKLTNAVQAAKDAAINAAKGLTSQQTTTVGSDGIASSPKPLSSVSESPSLNHNNISMDKKPSSEQPEDGTDATTAMMERAINEANKLKQSTATSTSSVSSSSKWDEVPNPVPVERDMTFEDEKIQVEIPKNEEKKELIDRLARYISKDGQPLENMIREREAANTKYDCLNKPDSKDAIYYRWKVYSLCMGDKEDEWREKPFQITSESSFWVPPKMPEKRRRSVDRDQKEKQKEKDLKDKEALRKERYKFSTGAQLEKARDRQDRDKKANTVDTLMRGRPLSDRSYEKFQEKLRTLTSSRRKIKEAMGFALDYADCSGDVIELLEGSLLVNETPINVKIARLYLLSDILHNSSVAVKHASTYRTLLQHALPKVIEHLNEIFRNPNLGRMTAKNLEEKVMLLLKVWEEWSIYPPVFLGGLEATFQRKIADLDDDLLVLQKGVTDESSLDLDSLIRKAKYNGIYYDIEKDNAMRLFKKLTFAEEYIRIKQLPPQDLEEELQPASQLTPQLLGVSPAPSWQIGGSQTSQRTDHPSSSLLPVPVIAPLGQWGAVEEENEEEVDGLAMDEEDIDGISMDTYHGTTTTQQEDPSSIKNEKNNKRKSDVTTSKSSGSRFSDESDNEDDDVDGEAFDDSTFFNQKSTPTSSESDTAINSQLSREEARNIEVEVLKYRDSLELQETLSKNDIEVLCCEKRNELMISMSSSYNQSNKRIKKN